MIKLKKKAKGFQPTCLPTLDYQDTSIKAIIAGYGKFRRPTCQVGSHGPTKFRYCGVDKECREKGDKFKNATCEVTFPYKGKILKGNFWPFYTDFGFNRNPRFTKLLEFSGCQTKIPSPSFSQKECRRFLEKEKFNETIDEFEIYDMKALKLLGKCYRNYGEYGWCGTYMNDDISLVSSLKY